MPWQRPEGHFGRGPVEICLISAVRTHALCVHTQDRLGERHRRAGRRGTAAHRSRLAAHTLHTHAYAGLIRPREKHPRNSDRRHESQREPAGHGVVHTQKSARNQRNWWRGFRTITHLRATDPTKPLVRAPALCSRLGGCPTQSRARTWSVPRNLTAGRTFGTAPRVIPRPLSDEVQQVGHRGC